MEKIVIDYKDGKLVMGVVRVGVWHYCDLPATDDAGYLQNRAGIRRLVDAMASKHGKSHIKYNIQYTPAADGILDIAEIFFNNGLPGAGNPGTAKGKRK